ncbi:MAG TPA: YaeQ family protein [Ramlibacter sp.]|uniref:YaeQ family protein n=1 Tax=Ramlibacter sp. TaxID=1917967 RepID=UPI002B9F7531|nr:YaeQ family protein [Ramlibacter sp.]HVZ47079.1 YaeQ family protein [Ramlibacter sp.]
MALKSTIFKATLCVADIDHGYYADHALTIARHPSENDERMMMRLAAFALHAHQIQSLGNGDATLSFGAGVSTPDEADLWLRDFTGAIRAWIDVGQPDDSALAKASRQADEVTVYAFHHAADVWWRGIENKVARLANLSVWRVAAAESQALAELAQRTMHLQATVQEGTLLVGDAARHVSLERVRLK